MKIDVYSIKTRREFLLFKWLKIIVYWVSAWWGLWLVINILIPAIIRLRGRTQLSAEYIHLTKENMDLILELIPWLATAVILYYILSTAWFSRVKRFEFDDDNKELRIYAYRYFTHIPLKIIIPYNDINSTFCESHNFLNGTSLVLKIKKNTRIKARINGANNAWQKLPNTVERIHNRIQSVKHNS